jgi:2-polyprenyl-3-methyl-5-hydroxy-6-metoxy-1,4-benzoquinol methylase
LACGRGEIAAGLVQDGARVRGSRFRADDYELSDAKPAFDAVFRIDETVDLEKPLPYDSNSFDLVILAEVIEHLESHRPIVAEIGRILRPGGHLILTTPNIARLHSRLHFFFSGTHKLIRRRVGWDVPLTEMYAYHANPVDFPLLHTLLFHAGLRVEDLKFTRLKWEHTWLALAFPFIALTVARETSHRLISPLHAEGERNLRRWMLHPAMLFSEQLLLVARKHV